MTNAFEALAERQVSAPIRRREARIEARTLQRDADAPMVGTLQEREQQKQAKQFRWYQVYLREKRDAMLADPVFGMQATHLVGFLKNMQPEDSQSLLQMIEHQQWTNTPRKVRQEILSWCATAIADVRITHGLAPFDDSLMDEPPTVFEQLRTLLQPDRHDQ